MLMSVVDFSHYQKQKQIFSIIEQIHNLMVNLDSVDKIEQLKKNLDIYYELKHGANTSNKNGK